MYTIEYKTREESLNFTTPARHPFEAVKIWQEATKVFEQVEMISLVKEDYKVRLF